MNRWSTQAAAMQQAPSGHLNPASIYNNLSTSGQYDLAAQYQPGLQNGHGATPTPSFPSQQTFQPGSVVPAKRPHDGMSHSPQLPQTSRSQTPNYGGAFPSQQNGNQQFPNAPTPYSHLQQPGSSNATPSPTMQNQPFRPPTTQQSRVAQTASPSPFPHPQNAYGNAMPPSTPQHQTQSNGSMAHQSQMAAYSNAMGLNASISMAGMSNSMPAQMSNLNGMDMQAAQRQQASQAYQIQMMQEQKRLRDQRAAGGQQSPLGNANGQQQPGGQTANGQMTNGRMANGQMTSQMMVAQQMQHQQKRAQFYAKLQQQAQAQGRSFNGNVAISGRPVDLFALFTYTCQLHGSRQVDQNGQWQTIANKLGFSQPQFPSAPEELKALHATMLSNYERMWFGMRQKQEQARMHAHQMAGLGGPAQASPTKMQPPTTQQDQYLAMQRAAQLQLQAQQNVPPPQATPVQVSAQLPPNGISTPQQLNHRRTNSMNLGKAERMTPQPAPPSATAPSPQPKVQRSPSVKQEATAPRMKSEEGQSTDYVPQMRSIDHDGGYDATALFELGSNIARAMPNMPTVDEMGVIDTRAITLSLASGIHGEVRYALDALAIISRDERVGFDLEKCDDLIDVIIDCAEEQIELLSEEAVEVSDVLDLPPYEDIMRSSRDEAETLQEVHQFGSPAYDLDRAADKLLCITTILRNFSFYEHNHPLLTAAPLVKWLSNTIRLLGTRNMLLRSYYNTLDFYKDMVTFLSNITQSLELSSRDDALHILHFLLAFAPQPSPRYAGGSGKLAFTSFTPSVHRFLPPAVDCLAKLLARQDPNRMLYRSIFTASNTSLAVSESPLDLLTRAFALSISVLPDRSKGSLGNATQLRIVEARKAYMTQGMLAADILTSLAPSNDTDLARSWIESEDGWAVSLLNLAALLSVDRSGSQQSKGRELGMDTESFKLITHRALAMMKRLAEKAGKGGVRAPSSSAATNGEAVNGSERATEKSDALRWEGIPQGHAILGALMIPNMDKVALGLLCGLHEMTMQT